MATSASRALPRNAVTRLMQSLHKSHCGCPVCSSVSSSSPTDILHAAQAIRSGGKSRNLVQQQQQRGYATPVDMPPQGDYAFEVAASNLRFGEGVTRVRPSLHTSRSRKLTPHE
jgi:hydroxyacid-oxoacid transhydrogenase